MNHQLLLLLIGILACAPMSYGSVLELRPGASTQAVKEFESFGVQEGSDQEILDRLSHKDGETINYGRRIAGAFSRVWLRVVLQNTSDKDLQRILYLPNNFAARSFDFYFYRDGVFLEHKSYRQDKALMGDEIIGRSSYTSFTVPAQGEIALYVKADSGYEQLNQNFQIGTRQQFINWEVLTTFFVGLYLGVLFLTVIVNVMQAVAYQDKAFFWYSAYTASIFLGGLGFFGIWVRMFAMSQTQQFFTNVGSNLVLITGTYFVRHVLDADIIIPRLSKVLRLVPVLAVASSILRFIPSLNGLGFAMLNLNSICFHTLACIVGVVAIARGRELAWLYSVSFFIFGIGIVYIRLANMNIVAAHPIAFYVPALAQIIAIIMLSYVMFIRNRSAYREALTSQGIRSVNEKLNLLLKILSHDIANPLQAISLYSSMALDKVKTAKSPEKDLEKALEAVTMQARIIRHAKEAVRQMQLGQKLQIQPIAVSQIIDELVQVFQPLCQDRDIQLEIDNQLREDIVIQTDPTILVHSIFGNILSNSIKYSPRKGVITVRVRLVNRRLIFDLVDNGPGISKEKRVEIFTLNVGKSFNEQLTGAGSFGLSILHMCSELLQGHLDIGPSEISASGQEMGLRISVSLPLHHAL